MRRGTLLTILCVVALLASILPAALPAQAEGSGTTTLTITKYAPDGVTVLDEVTIDCATMASTIDVKGDETTHRFMQGPTMDDTNLWDPDETLNLKDKGTLKGTDLKDLCELVGGALPGDEVRVEANDGFGFDFPYANVYDPAPEQGAMVVCWWRDGEYVPTYDDGMQLVFFAETTNGAGQLVFGNWDMHECMPEELHHYFGDYPSSNGLSVKWIDKIEIYTHEWELTLDGASTYVMTQSEFEDGAACHGVTWDDGGNIWSGIPLWLLVGYVDDSTQHGPGAFNDGLAAVGYEVKVVAADEYSKTFTSQSVARNDDMIIANELNGAPLPADKYPLRLVGPELTGGQKVSQLARIELLGLSGSYQNPSLDATVNVVLPSIGIAIDRSSIDYGDVGPGESSAEETVVITNIGTSDVDVMLQVDGATADAQDFYELSLYVDGALYDRNAVIASILVGAWEDVITQLHVPGDWNKGGVQQAEFIFWAEASP